MAKGSHNAVKTHCRHGHPYDEDNTYRHDGRRYCRECVRTRQRLRMRRVRALARAADTC